MIQIALHGAEFFAYHGFYPEEQKLGCRFSVDVTVGFEPLADLAGDDLDNTVDYEKIYLMACEEMKQPRKLIETVGQSILGRVKNKYPFVETIDVTIKKLNPPLNAKVDYSAVILNYRKA